MNSPRPLIPDPRLGCAREHDVAIAVVEGRWPCAVEQELDAHAQQCPTCKDVAAVATLINEGYARARQEVHVPSAGQVWWRVALRNRREPADAAQRPLVWVYGLAAACAAGLVAAFAAAAWPTVTWVSGSFSERVAGVLPDVSGAARSFLDLAKPGLPVIIAVATGVVIASVVLAFALRDDEARHR